eukprot:COSAG02_NODE_6708_length_3407_cov_3.645103_7_plen_215_part_00
MGMVGLDPFQLSVIQAADVDDCKDTSEKQCVAPSMHRAARQRHGPLCPDSGVCGCSGRDMVDRLRPRRFARWLIGSTCCPSAQLLAALTPRPDSSPESNPEGERAPANLDPLRLCGSVPALNRLPVLTILPADRQQAAVHSLGCQSHSPRAENSIALHKNRRYWSLANELFVAIGSVAVQQRDSTQSRKATSMNPRSRSSVGQSDCSVICFIAL